MKNILVVLMSLFVLNGFSQEFSYYEGENTSALKRDKKVNLFYELRGTYQRPVKKESLVAAKTIGNIGPGYPVNWIPDYVSTEISSTYRGKAMKAVGKNYNLTEAQKDLLKSVDVGADVIVDIYYLYKNTVTENIDTNKMHFSVTVIPEKEAEYIGGYQQMKNFLEKNVINIINETNNDELLQGSVVFTINEEGNIVNPILTRSTRDPKFDKLLLDAVNKMPQWKPAENLQGVKIKQEFMFNVGNGGC
jgi:hypothetical protein